MAEVPRYGLAEVTLTAEREFAAPLWDVTCAVEVTSPAGAVRRLEAFWDGGRTWRARFSPDAVGTWRWRSTCPQDQGLEGRTGTITCVVGTGDNPVLRHGPIRVAADQRHLETADGEPFLWLADTAWNGGLRSTETDWETYLSTRRAQGFNAIQLVMTQWRGCRQRMPEPAYLEGDKLAVNPGLFQRLDAKMDAINAHGLYAVPVVLWALTPADPGLKLSVPDALRLARYIVARYGGHQVVWFLGGDGNYKTPERVERWRTIGRGLLDLMPDRLATMHPCGRSWVHDDFGAEPWYGFTGYQSSHGGGRDTQEFIVKLCATRWRDEPAKPTINLEPLYEGYTQQVANDPKRTYAVRRALWWSLLATPTAGVTFGTGTVWNWAVEPEKSEGHENLGTVESWTVGLKSPSVASFQILARFFADLPWWTLRPAQELLASQPGQADVFAWQTVSRSDNGELIVAYLPLGGTIALTGVEGYAGQWFDPRTGASRPAESLTAPDGQDWVLVLRRR